MTSPHDFDDDLSRRLAGLADDAASYTSTHLPPLPSESVRQLGTQRRHRRFGGIAVAALACAIMATGVGLGASRLQDGPPLVGSPQPTSSVSSTSPGTATDQPTPTPSSRTQSPRTPAGSGSASSGSGGATNGPVPNADLLPLSTELAYHDFGDYRVVRTAAGQGTLPDQPCVRDLSALGATGIARRDYQFGTGEPVLAWAWVLRFDTPDQAVKATTVLQSWGASCADDDTAHPVQVGQGTAELYLHSTRSDGGIFHDLGVTQVGGTVAVILSQVRGADSNWALTPTDSTGLPLHPWIRSLPLVNARIAGTPGRTIEPSYPVTACTGSSVAADAALVAGSGGGGDQTKPATYRLTVRNEMKVACTITGFPRVQIADDQGDPVGAASESDGEPGATVTLEPGQSATATIEVEGVAGYGTSCKAVPSSAFLVTLPGQTEPAATYTEGLTGCANDTIVLLRVSSFDG